MGSFSGKQLLYFYSCLHSLWGSTLGEKNLLLGSKFFPLRVDPPFFFPFERATLCKKNGSWELFPFVKMIENHGGVPTHLKSWSVETLVARPAGTTSSWRLA